MNSSSTCYTGKLHKHITTITTIHSYGINKYPTAAFPTHRLIPLTACKFRGTDYLSAKWNYSATSGFHVLM